MYQKYFVVPLLSLILAMAKNPIVFYHLWEAISEQDYLRIAYHGCRCARYWWQQSQTVKSWIAERKSMKNTDKT
ncbi:hypothetical protein C8E02_3201 [Vogesella indigofera]|uniref:Uncharacterized protein n=1 Tax=Vogesella indigofera TaxID=45465 RepID=A0A495AX15_VOGIN|nr:hypothetical protein C8E02_3201 [Vogesella indigofera]